MRLLCSVVPWSFENLKELVYLSLQTPIRHFSVVAPAAERPQVFRGFSGLIIPREETSRLSSFFCEKMTQLQHRRLSRFQSKHFPKEMGCLENLRVLHLMSSTVIEIPQSLGHLRRLQKLNLCLKELRKVPPGVFEGLRELVVLDLDLERLTSFPIQVLGQLALLEALDLRLPAIERLADEQDGLVCVELRQLKFFILHCDSVSTVEGVQLACPSLERLILELGEAETLPPGFITCSTKFQVLSLERFFCLEELCKETEILLHARTLVLWDCPALKELPDGMMNAVESLVVVRCPGMQRLPADVDEYKARSMHYLACDARILPPAFVAFPSVLSISEDDTRAVEEADSFFHEIFLPPSVLGLL